MTESFINGWISGSVGVTLSHPMDTIKTCIQDNKPVKLGIRPLYRGFIPPLFGVGFEKAIVFGVYTNAYRYISNYSDYTILNNIASGSLAGLSASFVVTPVERIKILLQTSKQFKKDLSFRYLFRGLSATFTREVPGFAIYFNVYENLKKYTYTNKNLEIPIHSSFLFGGLAGCFSWIFIYPQDCIKTRMQANTECNKTFTQIVREIYKEGGLKIFYRGFHFALMRALPLHAGTFATMEILKRYS